MAKAPDPLEHGDPGFWQYTPPSDNGLVLWKQMPSRTPQQRQKQHDEWDRINKGKPDA